MPDRFYHTINHIKDLDLIQQKIGLKSENIQFMIWFHDAIYKPKSKLNEDESIELFNIYVNDL